MNMRKIFVLLGGGLLVVLTTGFLLFEISKSRTFQFFGGLTSRVETNEKVIALTFDDAPTAYTQEVLKMLKDKNIKATFYAIGSQIEKYPNLAKDIASAGMELGNHSYSHNRILLKDLRYIDNEVQTTNKLIRKAGYTGEITFRPPNGKKLFLLPWYLQTHNIKTLMWDVEPDTYSPKNLSITLQTKFIKEYTISNVRPGSIILLHPFCDSCWSDRKALPEIIDELQSKGYRFVTVLELLKYKNN